IWFKNGKTAIFEQVENLDAAEKAIVFDYYGKSTETKRSAAFFLANIAGFAESV
ncbi:TPA: hypothetical protein U0279_001942, partial [Listeria monocytogenes]|nr:hypothetical protein [Listeria monocytogenes]